MKHTNKKFEDMCINNNASNARHHQQQQKTQLFAYV